MKKKRASMVSLPDYLPRTMHPLIALGIGKEGPCRVSVHWWKWAGNAYAAVSEAYGIEVSELKPNGERSSHYISEARQVVMYILKHHYALPSLKDIARVMGGYHHTTILSGLRHINALYVSYTEVKARVDKAMKMIEQIDPMPE